MAWSCRATCRRRCGCPRIHRGAGDRAWHADPAHHQGQQQRRRGPADRRRCCRPDVTIVCVQNGLYSENLVKDLVGDRALVLRAITQVGGVLVRSRRRRQHRRRLHAARIARAIAGDRGAADRGRARRPHRPRHQEGDVAQGHLQLRDQSDHDAARIGGRRHRRSAAERAEAADHRRMPGRRQGRRRHLRRGFRRADRSRLRRRPHHCVDAAGPDEGPQDRDRSHERRGRRSRREVRDRLPGQRRHDDDDSLSGNRSD